MAEEMKLRIRRDGQEIGQWDKFQLREYLSQGRIIFSDEAYHEDEDRWLPLVPQYRRKWNFFDWTGDEDALWYYVREGQIHGPRVIDELVALFNAGYLTAETMVAAVGFDEWQTLVEFLEFDGEKQDGEAESEEGFTDLAGEAVSRYILGDTLGAGTVGIKAVGKVWDAFKGSKSK